MTMRFLLVFLFLVPVISFAGTRVTPNVGTNTAILTSTNTSYLSGNTLWKQGDTATSYIERLGRHTPVGVTPSRGVPTSRIAGAAKDLMRLTPGAVATSLALMAVVETAGWAFDELTGQITVPSVVVSPLDTSFYYWYRNGYPGTATTSLSDLCRNLASNFNPSWAYVSSYFTLSNSNSGNCYGNFIYTPDGSSINNYSVGNASRGGSGCPSGFSYDTSIGSCSSSQYAPVTSSDIDDLQITGDASFYEGLMRDACNLSNAPTRCFDGLVEQSLLSGPATVQGPKSTTTSYQTNSDGSTSTVETSTDTKYDIEYGDDHYVYTPKTTTETKVDGQTTETTTEQEDTAEDSEQKPEEEQPVSEIAGLQCQATVACSGDAIQCAIASTQKDTKCILEELATIEESEVRQQVQQDLSGSDYQPFGEGENSITDLSGLIDTSSSISSSCPVLPVLSFEFHGQTNTFDFSDWLSVLCEFAGWFGAILVIFSMRNGVEVIARGFG